MNNLTGIPSDPELQRMSDADLDRLLAQCPKYFDNPDWIRVAKEKRYRNRFAKTPRQGPAELARIADQWDEWKERNRLR